MIAITGSSEGSRPRWVRLAVNCPKASAGASRCAMRSRWGAVSGRRRRRPGPVSGRRTPRAAGAGLGAANALLAGPLDTATQLRIAAGIEGHPDNAAAALLGGFVVSSATSPVVEALRMDVPRDLRAVLFIPERRLSTDLMRKALPGTVPYADAVANLGAVALGGAGLAAGKSDMLSRLTVERIHEAYRAAAVPEVPTVRSV